MIIRLSILMILAIWTVTQSQAAPTIQQVTSPQGIKAWFIPEPKLDIISMSFSFRGGSAYEDAEKSGLSSLLADMLIEGTEKMSGPDLRDYLLENAIQLGFSNDTDRISGSFRVATTDLKKVVSLLKDILTAPRFDPQDLQRLIGQYVTSLQNSEKKPEYQTVLLNNKRLMGNHPYALMTSGYAHTVTNVKSDDLRRHLKSLLAKDSLIIGVCGRISEHDLGLLLDDIFGNLPAKNSLKSLDTPTLNFDPKIDYVASTNPQDFVMFAHPGLVHTDAQFMKLYLLSHIIGTSFKSRLFKIVRDDNGLAYSVQASLLFNEKAASLTGTMGTEHTKTQQAIDLVRKIWQDVASKGITADELADAKTYLIGVFPLNFYSTTSIAEALHIYQVFGLDLDYFKNRSAIINAVSLDEINNFARSFVRTDKLMFTVAGQQNVEIKKTIADKGTKK